MSCFTSILACLLALLVASPLCCCAGEAAVVEESSCCRGEPAGEEAPAHRCPCAADDPRELPGPLVPPPGSGSSLASPPDLSWNALHPRVPGGLARQRWTPGLAWHAPPRERRARLMRRTI